MSAGSDILRPRPERIAVFDTSAQALEFQQSGRLVRVVTEDRVDRLPIKIAMTTACERLGLTAWSLADFLSEIGFDP